jgi:hypothetical protein
MIDGLEPLFQQIADSMQEAIPEDWVTAQFEAIFYPDGSTYEAEYTRRADGKARSFLPASGGVVPFESLENCSERPGSLCGVGRALSCSRMAASTSSGATTTATRMATLHSMKEQNSGVTKNVTSG